MDRQPALFVSHGSPMLLLEDSSARRFLTGLGERYAKPAAVLMVSAHWESHGGPAVSLAHRNGTIHDFGGFPQELYKILYPAPGAPEQAGRAIDALRRADFTVQSSADRGLDHGAWVPLKLMYPGADVPVFQVSLIHGVGPAEHFRLGRALQSLRDQGVMIIGSGSLTHNLREYMGRGIDEPAPQWVSDFTAWFADRLGDKRIDEDGIADLLDYRSLAPYAEHNHPTEEHLLPLFVALGAAGEGATAERVHDSQQYGVIAMDAYAFSQSEP